MRRRDEARERDVAEVAQGDVHSEELRGPDWEKRGGNGGAAAWPGRRWEPLPPKVRPACPQGRGAMEGLPGDCHTVRLVQPWSPPNSLHLPKGETEPTSSWPRVVRKPAGMAAGKSTCPGNRAPCPQVLQVCSGTLERRTYGESLMPAPKDLTLSLGQVTLSA